MSTRPAPVRWPLLAADYQPEALQGRAVELLAWAGGARRVLVLDLPPGLDADAVRRWHLALQASPASDRAAVYGPWVWAAPVEDPQASARLVPPGGAVCGIIAASERRGGAWSIPANTLVQSAFAPDSDPRLPDPGFLHEERVNTLRSTERGLVLLGARTSSADPEWAFLNVRRAVDWLALQLPLDARWAVFEPNDARLWRRLELCVERRLRQLWQANALAGSSAADSYFVRCDASVHTQADLDAGRVVALVGLAVAAPVEFIVFRLSLARDGSSSLEVSGG